MTRDFLQDESSFAKLFDHTLLKADATPEDIARICEEAKQYGFASVCVNSCNAALAADLLRGSGVAVCCVEGFPLGAMSTAAKAAEAKAAVADGASEIDMVINIGWLRSGEHERVRRDIAAVAEAARPDAIVKVIIETCLLTDEQKVTACRLAAEAGAAFVKTSTGFSTGGATVNDVALMRRTVGDKLGVKASGGIRDLAAVKAMLAAGANRVGASATVAIMHEFCALRKNKL